MKTTGKKSMTSLLQYLFLISLVITGLACLGIIVTAILYPSPLIDKVSLSYPSGLINHSLPKDILHYWPAVISGLISIGIVLAIEYWGYRLFKALSEGPLFSHRVSSSMKTISFLTLALGVSKGLTDTIIGQYLLDHTSLNMTLQLSPLSLPIIFTGLVVWVNYKIYHEGLRLYEDDQLTI